MQLQVTNSPFNESQAELLNRLLPTLTHSQQVWLSGYLSALSLLGDTGQAGPAVLPLAAEAAAGVLMSTATIPQPEVSREVTVLFGSQTGNCQRLAASLSRKLEEQGFKVTVAAMNSFKPNGLKKIENLLLLVSTHGEGEPPDNARAFHEFLYSKRAPQLPQLRYSVLALGDTSYEFFCQTGKDFDQKLEELGAQRLTPRADCDLDYDEPVAEWFGHVIRSLSGSGSQQAAAIADDAVLAAESAESLESAYSRNHPFHAEVLENLNLNGRGSDRETRHLELSLAGSNITFEPGDSLGVYPENHPQLVQEIIAAMGWEAGESVPLNKKGEEGTLHEALLRHYEITVLTKPLLEQAAKLNSAPALQELLSPDRQQELKNYIHGRDLLDLIQDFAPWEVPARSFVTILRKLPARLYSIASSYNANPDEVHFTVRAVRYESHGRERYGVCSVHCAERAEPGATLPVYIQSNPNFKLPANPDTPVIMIGPGTGVAPFRSFLEEREEQGAQGKSWLFYGDRHFVTDFLYQTDWQRMLKDGVLSRLDVAFSRDTDEKVYVQHRILEKSRELYTWLQEGAHVYVCGDEKHMAHDVHAALVTVIQQEGGLSPEGAAAYLETLQQEQRYQRDVY
ncbi:MULTISPECIES: assimilatory sulfite reductase (NADPH) flavoprotein subunit [unclassified Paenibacillus]|uniref:assimilatory sulfite reductase (NADPH) flavoprotein subunit n=1 Tax=unclassified Paenibacillus TaxID=185978 RepID=UPI00096EBAFB|nr:assimilatory sulfite reductase (NADPH) flavoprotein subunit [Paenibacillus sp. FSL H8-0259]OMF30517.1 sulfite reductase [NADPH] flavoprotein, alpha-component [Paenibacillus sp. FSL H8-0259]